MSLFKPNFEKNKKDRAKTLKDLESDILDFDTKIDKLNDKLSKATNPDRKKEIEKEKIEKEIEKENKNEIFYQELISSQIWLEQTAMQSKKKFNVNQVKEKLLEFKTFITLGFDIKVNKQDFASHFIRWLNTQENKDNKTNEKWLSPA